jgi:DNA-binding transcriptional LysR family regulator
MHDRHGRGYRPGGGAATPAGGMELHQLRYFVAAAEVGTISHAARREHVTQPAMSRQIARLERQLGTPLFVRGRQRLQLTEAGRFLLPRARQLLCDAATSEQQLREQFGRGKRTLRLGCLGTFLDDLLAPVVRELKQRHRGLAVALFELLPQAQLERLAARELDAAILANLDPTHRERFDVERLSRHRFAAVLPEGHRLAAAASVALRDLADEDWVSLSDAVFPGRRAFVHAAGAAAGFVPRIVAEPDSLPAMLGAIASGQGVGIAPRHSEKLSHRGAVFVALRAPAPQVELLLVRPRGERTPELGTLAELLVAAGKRLADA